jgi:hypothetical protein
LRLAGLIGAPRIAAGPWQKGVWAATAWRPVIGIARGPTSTLQCIDPKARSRNFFFSYQKEALAFFWPRGGTKLWPDRLIAATNQTGADTDTSSELSGLDNNARLQAIRRQGKVIYNLDEIAEFSFLYGILCLM